MTTIATRSVLIVDDAPDVRALVRRVLEIGGFAVAGEAGDGRAGVEMAAALQPDVVLLDLAMPVLDGLEALPEIRAGAPKAAVVVLTGFADETLRATAASLGARGFLLKDNLVGTLTQALTTVLCSRPGAEGGFPGSMS